MKNTIILFATVLASTAAVGCSKEVTSSANIRTEGIAALIDVTAENDKSSTLHVELRVGGSSSNTFVILESGDKLTAEAVTPPTGGTTMPTTETKDLQAQSEGEYEAEFATAAADTDFKVMFDRGVDTDALANTGRMPAPFEITSLPDTQPSRLEDDITVTWTPPDTDADMQIKVTGGCIFAETIDVPGDSGSFIIKKGTLESTGGDQPSTCDLKVEVTRTQVGTADPVFDKESWFKLHQVRAAKFTSKP